MYLVALVELVKHEVALVEMVERMVVASLWRLDLAQLGEILFQNSILEVSAVCRASPCGPASFQDPLTPSYTAILWQDILLALAAL